MRQERLTAYDYLFTQTIQSELRERTSAVAGQYTFYANNEKIGLTIPDEIATYSTAKQEKPLFRLDAKVDNPTIEIDLHKLMNCAKEVTEKEHKLGIPSDNFVGRVKALIFLVQDNKQIIETHTIKINGLFHLVGALGVGKSTIIKLLVYYLAIVENRHVSIIMNTIVEAFEMARWLQLMGILTVLFVYLLMMLN